MMNKNKNIFNDQGFTLVELMVVIGILLFLAGGLYMTLYSGQETWATTETMIQVQENLRITMDRISKELQQSGSDNTGVMQVTIADGTGVGDSDILKFSLPILCQTGVAIIDGSGNVANWGAPLTWGCEDSTCMDADDNCATREYKYIEYKIDANRQLLRRVLDESSVLVREDIFAQNITNFQTVLSADNNIVTLTVTLNKTSTKRRSITISNTINVYLRNRG